ncbi:MAG: arsenate reductase ArsC [Candidatus Thorarchaeota archaeon]|nr:arsenate reductase ArsC [Candidatus Thorarchaeota archaeon]
MAEALLRLLGGDIFEVYSAGTKPAPEVNPHAITVLRELGCDTSRLHTKTVDRFTSLPFDLVVTVCDRAKQTCPFFPGAKMTLHWSLEDPAAFEGTESEVLNRFRSIRDEIVARIKSELL